MHQDRVRPCHSAPALGTSLPDLHKDWAHTCHICAGTAHDHCPPAPSAGIVPRIFAGTGHIPDLRRDWAHPCHICAGLGTPLPHLHRDRVRPSHIYTRTWLICTRIAHTPASSAPGPGSPVPHRHQDWADPCHICTGTRRIPAAHSCNICHESSGALSQWPQPDCSQPPTSSPELDTSPVLPRDRVHPCHIGAGLQRCARIGSIRTRSLFIRRSPFVRPSHSPPRPLPSLHISNRQSAPPPPPPASACIRLWL